MYKISEIISAPVISLYESENQGTIYNIEFDCKTQKCKFFCLLNENDNIEKVINVNDIYKIGKHCAFIKNTSCVELKSNYDYLSCNYTSLINLPIYNLQGDYIGTTKDIELDDKLNLHHLILTDGNIIEQNKIVNLGKSIILTNDIMVNIAKFKPKLKSVRPINYDSKVIMLKGQQPNSFKNIQTQNKPTDIKTGNNKILTDYKFLMGRILTQDIVAINGEIIARKGSQVDKAVVNKASLYGKLMEIARYSTKKLTNMK